MTTPNIEKLTSPPEVGQVYRVPTVFGQIALLNSAQVKRPEWWPVIRPSHQDSIYTKRTKSVWTVMSETCTILEDVEYYEEMQFPQNP